MNFNNQKIGLGFAAALLLGAVGSESALAQVRPQNQPKVSIDQAIQTVLAASPDTIATKAELESENGLLVYEVDLNNDREVTVNANSGQIIGSKQDDDDDDDALRPQDQPKLSINQAIQKVVAANPGNALTLVDLERENGVLVYEVKLNNDREVTVNANSGQTIAVEQDD